MSLHVCANVIGLQATLEGYDESDQCLMSLDELKATVPALGEAWSCTVWPAMCRAVVAACCAVQDAVQAREGSFEVFGFGDSEIWYR